MSGIVDAIHAAFHQPRTRIYRLVQGAIWALIVLSIFMLLLEPLLPEHPTVQRGFRIADRVLLALFAVEYLLRVLSMRPLALEVFHPGRLVSVRTHINARVRLALSPMLLIDLLAVLAFFPELRGLRALRLLRLLRTISVFRYANPFASIYHAFEENSLLFIFGFTVLILETMLGGLSMYFIEKDTNPNINTLVDGIWWALVTITTVGFGDITPVTTLGRIIGGVLMVAGMFTLALFAGFVGSSLVNAMLTIREEQFRMGDYVNHIVVLGYDETSEMLLDLFVKQIDRDDTRLVVFEDRDRPRELPPAILWVQGDPTKQSELDKVRLTHARAAVVVGLRSVAPQAADARTILTTFTIRSYLDERAADIKDRKRPLYVVAEILDSENVIHARAAGADEVIETRRVAYSMMAHTVRYHGTADAMSKVLISGSYNVYVGMIPEYADRRIAYGDLLMEMQLTKRGGLIIGLRPPGGEGVFNPAKEYVVEPGTQLIYLAEAPILEAPD